MGWNSFVIKEVSVVSSWLFFFLWWMIDLLLERCFHMTPIIRNAMSVEQLDEQRSDNCNNNMNEMKTPTTPTSIPESIDIEIPMHKIMTKAIDKNKSFRIQKQASLYYTKAIMCFIGFSMSLVMIFDNTDWIIDHFVYFDYETEWNYEIYHYIISLTLAFYGYEIVVVRKYSELNVSQFIHHWITVISCVAVLIGVLMPFVTCFLFFGVYCAFPLDFILGFRIHLSAKYPNTTQIACKICAVYYGMLCTTNIIIILLLVINGCIKYDTYPLSLTLFLFIVFLPLLLWDDWSFYKALRSYGRMNYNNVDLSKNKNKI